MIKEMALMLDVIVLLRRLDSVKTDDPQELLSAVRRMVDHSVAIAGPNVEDVISAFEKEKYR